MARLSTTRLLLLAKIREMDNHGAGVTKSEITRGLPDRTQANHWAMINELAEKGYLEHGGLVSTGPRWRLTNRGHEAIRRAFAAY